MDFPVVQRTGPIRGGFPSSRAPARGMGWHRRDTPSVPIQWLLTLTFRLLKPQGRGPVEQTGLFNLPKSLKTAPSVRLPVQTRISPVARLTHRVQPAADPWTPSLWIRTSSQGSVRGCWHHTHTSHPQSHSSCRTQTPITDTQEKGRGFSKDTQQAALIR